MKKEYKCICGKSFISQKALNGHTANCKNHYLQKDGNLDRYYSKVKNYTKYVNNIREPINNKIEQWLKEQHRCECCGKIMTEYYGSGKFCSRECANSRKHSQETKEKIRNSIKNHSSKAYHNLKIQEYNKNPNKCSICGKDIPYELRHRKTCSEECLKKSLSNAGKTSSSRVIKRSKSEIEFCNLCEEYFGKDKVIHNEPMFNGWDADIIIPELKIAILWNGPWHYRKVTKKHNLIQVQNRDKIKIKEIKSCGYIPYIIKDTGKYNKNKINKEFNKFIEYIKENYE